MEGAAESASSKSRLILTLSIIRYAAEALSGAKPSFEAGRYAAEHQVPIRLMNELVRLLVKTGFLVETADKGGCYVLIRAPETITVRDVVDIILQHGASPELLGLAHVDPAVEKMLSTLDEGLGRSFDQVTVKDLLKSET